MENLKKVRLLIVSANFALFVLLCPIIFVLFCEYVLEKCGKQSLQSGFLERVGRVTVSPYRLNARDDANTTLLTWLHRKCMRKFR